MISVIIPTLVGSERWSLVGLLDALAEQTTAPGEVLLCVDGPDVEGIPILAAWRNGVHPFDFRLFQRTAPRTMSGGGPGLAEQIMLANARGDVIIHLDSDGYPDRRMVEFVIGQSLTTPMMRCLWGQNVFLDPETGLKLPQPDPRLESYPKQPGIYPMPKSPLHAHGALWACPTKILRDLGGHCMDGIEFRAQDSRLGQRIQAVCRCEFVTLPEFRFNHFGLPTQYGLLHGGAGRLGRFEAAQAVKHFRESHRLPQLGHRDPLICNGGAAFWQTEALSGMYEELKA